MSLPPHPGTVVLYWSGDAPSFGVVAGEERRRVVLVPPSGREERVPATRLVVEIARHEPPARTDEGRRLAAAHAAAARDEVGALAREVDVATLWELTRDRGEPLGDEPLADLALGAASGPARAAVVLALAADGVRFARRPAGWLPREAVAVDGMIAEREARSRRRAERDAAFDALARARDGAAFTPTGSETERRILQALESLAVHDLDAPEKDREVAAEVLAALRVRGDRPHEAAFRLLRAAGRFSSDDANLAIERFGLRRDLPEETIEEGERAAAAGFAREGRVDRTASLALTIDDPRTKEIDDALTVAPADDGDVEVAVHIADPGAFVALGGAVDREAAARGTTYYFPDGKLLMLPPAISERAASLVCGEDRPALTFHVRVDASGRLVAASIERSVVRVAARLDYDAADALLERGDGPIPEALRRLEGLAVAREAARERAGAVLLRAGEVEIHVGEGGALSLARRDPDARAQRIVAEAMILAGEAAATWLEAARVPAIYRRQASPDRPLPHPDPALPPIVHARALRRVLRRGEASLSPGRHFALGLASYAQVTSPLRRYQDLALHRQIASVLTTGRPAYDAAAMTGILAATERAELDGRRAERMADRYWLLVWLARRAGDTVTGVVADVEPRPVVVLDETLLEEPVPALVGAAVGDRVRLRVERVNPRADVLVLRPV